MQRTKRSSTVLGIVPIVAASVVWVGGTAMAQDQQGAVETQKTRQETTQTVRRYYEDTTTIVGRGVTGDAWRPPANEIMPEITKAEQLLYNLSQPGPS